MDLTWASEIDTPCVGCGGDAVDWVQIHDGTRRYACQECLAALLRTTEAENLGALPETPNAVQCPNCSRLTLAEDAGPANRCPECGGPEVQDALQQAVAEAEQRED